MLARILNWRLERILLYALLISCVAFQSCYALLTVPGYSLVGYILLSLTLVAILFSKPTEDPIGSPFVTACAAVISVGIILSTIINSGASWEADTVRLLLVIATAALVAVKVPFRVFVEGYISVMRILTIIALAVWFISSILQVALPLPEVSNFRGLIYQVGVFFFQSVQYSTDSGLYQCMSIFWEPGIYSSFLLIAIALQTCGVSEMRIGDIALFSVAVILTFSTAGIVLLPFVIVPVLFKKSRKGSVAAFFIVALLLLCCAMNMPHILSFLADINPSLFGKLVQTDLITTSTRLTSPQINLEGWSQNYLLGMGLENASKYYESAMTSFVSVDSMTSTSTFLLCAFGVTGLFIVVLWCVGILKLPFGSIYQKMFLLVFIIVVLNKETHTATMLMYCLLFYFVQQSLDLPRRK